MKYKIEKTLLESEDVLQSIANEYCIIGASALCLLGFNIGNTSDIDILTTSENSNKLQQLWSDKLEINPTMKESNLFRSNFARFSFPLMDIEVMGDLQINKNNSWQTVRVNAYEIIKIGLLEVKIPTLDEQLRLLHLFGRKKDLERMRIIEEQQNKI